MKYNEFTERVRKELRNYLPEPMKNFELEEKAVTKVNEMLVGLTLVCPINGNLKAGPTIYYKHMYETYQSFNEDFEKFMEHLASEYQMAIKRLPINVIETVNSTLAEKVILTVMNTEKNEELLKTIPHKEYFDLSIAYRVMAEENEEGCESILVTNSLLKEMEMSAEELHECAVNNTERLLPTKIEACMNEFFVLTNERMVYGAAGITNNLALDEIATRLDDNLMILPSSIHEVFVIRADMTRIGEMLNIIHTVNQTVVEEKDYLSDSLYYYNRNRKSLQVIESDIHFNAKNA